MTPDPDRWAGATPVRGILPAAGWELLEVEYQDGDRFWSVLYIARGPDRDVMLQHSRFGFAPTQQRFDWLIQNDLGRSRLSRNFTDQEIDRAMAADWHAAHSGVAIAE